MGFVEFTGKDMSPLGGGREPRVSLVGSGYASVNRVAMALLGDVRDVVILYDADAKLLAFRPSSPDVAHSYRVTANYSKTGAKCGMISIRRVLSGLGLRDFMGHSFPASMKDGMLIADLNHPKKIGRVRRTKESSTAFERLAAKVDEFGSGN